MKLEKRGIIMRKYLFFDIDGTLVGESHRVTENNAKAISQVREKGHKAFLCSGRAPTSIVQDIIDVGFDGIICSAGGFIMIDGHFVFENLINQYVLSEVMTLFTNHHILYTLETRDAIYQTPGVSEFFDRRHQEKCKDNLELKRFFELRRRGENREPIRHFDILKTPVAKICFIAKRKQDYEACIPFLEDYFHIVTFSKPEDDFVNGELIIKGCTKADGIKRLMRYYNASMEDTIGFGDSMNDFQMMEAVKIACVSKKAPQVLLDMADYTFDDPDDDGIAKVLKELNL